MSTWILVWFLLAGVSTLAMIVVVVALARHVLSVTRTARRFQEEMAPLSDQLQALGRRASERSSKLQTRGGRR